MTECIRRARSYWTTCPCDDCRRDRLRAGKAYHVGIPHRIPHDVAWKILAAKIDAGWTARAIGSATGLDPANAPNGRLYFSRHVTQHRRGRSVYLGPAVAEAVVNMGIPTEGQVGAEPSRRRLRALATIGHGLNSLARETGISFSTLAMIRADAAVRCSAQNANRIAETYARLHMTVGSDEQARRSAREKSWPAPMAWVNIDDPNEQPTMPRDRRDDTLVDQAVVERVLGGEKRPRTLTPAECAEIVRRADAAGRSGNEIDRLYGIKAERYRKAGAAA